jgi:hypothetical protein
MDQRIFKEWLKPEKYQNLRNRKLNKLNYLFIKGNIRLKSQGRGCFWRKLRVKLRVKTKKAP